MAMREGGGRMNRDRSNDAAQQSSDEREQWAVAAAEPVAARRFDSVAARSSDRHDSLPRHVCIGHCACTDPRQTLVARMLRPAAAQSGEPSQTAQ